MPTKRGEKAGFILTSKWAWADWKRFLVKLNWWNEINAHKMLESNPMSASFAFIHYSKKTLEMGTTKKKWMVSQRNTLTVSFGNIFSSLAIAGIRWRWSDCTMQFNDDASPGQDSGIASKEKKHTDGDKRNSETKLNEGAQRCKLFGQRTTFFSVLRWDYCRG